MEDVHKFVLAIFFGTFQEKFNHRRTLTLEELEIIGCEKFGNAFTVSQDVLDDLQNENLIGLSPNNDAEEEERYHITLDGIKRMKEMLMAKKVSVQNRCADVDKLQMLVFLDKNNEECFFASGLPGDGYSEKTKEKMLESLWEEGFLRKEQHGYKGIAYSISMTGTEFLESLRDVLTW